MKPRLFIVYYGGDDPRKNTAAKMIRLGLASRTSRPPRGSIVLNPSSPIPISRDDSLLIRTRGLTVVDASWRRLRMPRGPYTHRRLPLLLAANPVNYGKPFLLSSAEAAAAALYLTGYREYADSILSAYKWGAAFVEINRDFLREYSAATNAGEMIEKECGILNKILGYSIGACSAEKLAAIYKRIIEQYLEKGR